MSTVCVGLVFRSKYVQFPIICSLQYSININTVEVDPHSDLLHIYIVKPKNCYSASFENPPCYRLSSTQLFVVCLYLSMFISDVDAFVMVDDKMEVYADGKLLGTNGVWSVTKVCG